jgi:hypothetical protein
VPSCNRRRLFCPVAVSDIKELKNLTDRMAPFGDLTTSVILSTPLRQKTLREIRRPERGGRAVKSPKASFPPSGR